MAQNGAAAIGPAAFRPDGNLQEREIPIALQLPDWNHWLPRVHPLDAWGDNFESSAFSKLYRDSKIASRVSADQMPLFFDNWGKARTRFLPHLPAESKKWSPEMGEMVYSAQLWQMVKTWEITQELNLEARGKDSNGAGVKWGDWPNTIPAATAPTEANIPDSPAGMGGSGLTNEYYSNAWYYLQVLVNDGNHGHHGRLPVDWTYQIGHYRKLQQFSGQPEAGRLLVTIIKAMQSTDPNAGPDNLAEGWRPEQTIDPRIMVDPDWAPAFLALDPGVKRAITEAYLAAWLDKTLQYPAASYFKLGLTASAYTRPADVRNISGGNVWEAAAQFQAAGVRPQLLGRLKDWGKAYTSLAQLFHY
jgi:hypothetical protein